MDKPITTDHQLRDCPVCGLVMWMTLEMEKCYPCLANVSINPPCYEGEKNNGKEGGVKGV